MCSDGGKAAWLWACTEKLHTSPKMKCRISLVDNLKPKLSSRKNTAFGRTALILASPSSPLFFLSCWSSLECKVEGIAKIIWNSSIMLNLVSRYILSLDTPWCVSWNKLLTCIIDLSPSASSLHFDGRSDANPWLACRRRRLLGNMVILRDMSILGSR